MLLKSIIMMIIIKMINFFESKYFKINQIIIIYPIIVKSYFVINFK